MNDTSLNPQVFGDQSGRTLGDYRLIRLLGQGGMAHVYLADQTSLRRHVAVKILKEELASDETYVKRFHNEAQAAAALVHANIVQIHEVSCVDGHHLIVQEYVPGRNLKQILGDCRRLQIPTVVMIARQIAAALSKAHQQGVVHRDIKPENALIAPDGTVKVADFGLARISTRPRQLELTEVGVTLGTPLYMSPEQVEGRKVDGRSDVYSLGVTCYQMLAGEPPFQGETPIQVALKHLREEPTLLSELLGKQSDLFPIVGKMMAKSPEDRYADGAELLNALRSLPLDGADQSWVDDIAIEFPEDPSHGTMRFSETQQLAAVISNQRATAPVPARASRYSLLGLGAVASVLLGALFGYVLRAQDPLHGAATEVNSAIEKKTDARSQFIYAALMNTEDAWRSVFDYFPPDEGNESSRQRYYALRAKQQLARLFMQNGDWELALDPLSDLADLESTEAEFLAFGLAGQAMAFAQLDQLEDFADSLSAAFALREHLDEQTRSQFDELWKESSNEALDFVN